MIFFIVFILIVMQRLIELAVAKRNERYMKQKGALEFGKAHYKYIVLLHTSFLISIFLEVTIFHRQLSPIWYILLTFLFLTQLLRVWTITSLGSYWNTKIIVLPNASVTTKGPYKFIRHPNYMIVILEILLIPLLFQAYITAVVFSFLNLAVLSIRIREEEKALIEITNYKEAFQYISRFRP
ncbi:isoprenylcysteine carboxyl methyltransferase family protein [Bacillus rhizoplanae]|uniref:isoprenylcysteine carboxyl methyltransferase family protein n=2 Tax=Bacillus rhizoplanae TaxID=2880966 RepID=UPI003D193D52